MKFLLASILLIFFFISSQVNSTPAKDWLKSEIHLEDAANRFGRYCKFDGQLTAQARSAGFRNLSDCENDFITMIKQLHTSEADLLMEIVNKRLPYKGITPRLVNQAWPELLPE